MPGEFLLINPRRRKARKSNPKRRAAAPKRRRAVRRRNPVHALPATNPVRRRRRRNPAARRMVRRSLHRRNPSGRAIGNQAMALFQKGAVGAGGALLVDLGVGWIPLPDILGKRDNADGSINYLYHATKAGLAIGIATLGKGLLGKWAVPAAEGAMTVNLYDLARRLLPANVGLGYISPAALAGMGKYLSGNAASNVRRFPGTSRRPVPVPGAKRAEMGMYVR